MEPAQVAAFVRESFPAEGLFSGQEWRISPTPFHLGSDAAKEIESLGRVLLQFNKAVNRLYRQSIEGKQPSWVAGWLDQGKPAALIELQRSAAMKNEWPRVIRPDLLLTDTGLAITELDSVPGGIGVTAEPDLFQGGVRGSGRPARNARWIRIHLWRRPGSGSCGIRRISHLQT